MTFLFLLLLTKDSVFWSPSTNGRFSVKSATWLQMEDLGRLPVQGLINNVWKQILPPKVKLFAWSLIKSKLQTRRKLSKFITNIGTKCPLCNIHEEDQEHLFLHCQYAKQVWSCPNDILSISMDPNHKISEWLKRLSHQYKNDVSNLSKALTICWQIWSDRNGSIFRNEKPMHSRSFIWAILVERWRHNTGSAKLNNKIKQRERKRTPDDGRAMDANAPWLAIRSV